jgi:hypothetical protein
MGGVVFMDAVYSKTNDSPEFVDGCRAGMQWAIVAAPRHFLILER